MNLSNLHVFCAVCLVVFFSGCATYRNSPPAHLSSEEITVLPYVEVLGDTHATVVWETAEPMFGWLEYTSDDTREIPRVRGALPGTLQETLILVLTPIDDPSTPPSNSVSEFYR